MPKIKTVRLKAPGGLENLKFVEEDRPEPGPGQLLVRIRASSLNPHDDFVVLGTFPSADGRIPLNDGAGEVVSVGENVKEFKVGDNVVSTFWPYWLGGEMTPATKRDIP
jgi:NADPH:quinone reductase-like Zn-dependent oxidoreductase